MYGGLPTTASNRSHASASASPVRRGKEPHDLDEERAFADREVAHAQREDRVAGFARHERRERALDDLSGHCARGIDHAELCDRHRLHTNVCSRAMRSYDLAPLPIAALGLTVLATCCPAEPAKPTLVQPVTTTAPAPSPTPPPAPPAGPPVARTVDVVDHQFGLSVPDPYRWMEGIGNTEYTTWLAAQGTWAKGELAA